MHIIQVILSSFFLHNLLFYPEGARVICWSSAGEANCGNMPKSGCLVSNCLINYTNDKAIPVAKFVASRSTKEID